MKKLSAAQTAVQAAARTTARSTSLFAGALIALAGAAALPAQAEGLYVGGNLGTPHFNDPVNNIEGNGSGVAGKVYGGYEVTPNFALEAGFAELGHIDDASGRAKGHAPFLDAVGILPVGHDISLLGRVGVAHVKLDTPNGDDSDTTLKAGLGAQYQLTPNAALRAEWERYRPEVFGTRTDIDQYTVGVKWGF